MSVMQGKRLNVNPLEIIAAQKMKQRRIGLYKSIMVDAFLLVYAYLVVERVIFYRYILELKEIPFSWLHVLILAGAGLIVAGAWTFSGTSIGSRLFKLSKGTSGARLSVEVSGWFLFNITFIAGWIITKMSIIDLLSVDGLNGAGRIFNALFTPEFGIFNDALFAVIETIYIALLATILSVPAAIVLSFLTARNLMIGSLPGKIIYIVLRFILNFIRSIEPLIWAIVFSVWVGIGPYAGMIALLVHTIASNAKLYSEAIEGVEEGPVEAITATGASRLLVIWFGVVPQVVLPFLSFTIYRWDINVRMATVIGLVGGGGIGTMLMQYQGLAKWNEVGLIVILVACVVWVMDYISAKIREAIY